MGIFKTIDDNCKSVELRSLAEKAKGTLLHAQAESTKSKYFKAWLYFKNWQFKHFGSNTFPVPLFHTVLYLQFIIDTSKHKSRFYKFLYGIRWAHRKSSFSSPTDDPIIKEMTLAAKRLLGRPTIKKKPVKSSLIDDIYRKNLDKIKSDSMTRRDCILLNLTNKGFLRISELCNIQRKHIEIKQDSMDIFVPKRKNDPESEGHTICIGKNDSVSCAYNSIVNILNDIPHDPNSFLVFKTCRKKITSEGLSTSYARVLYKNVLSTVLSADEVKQMSTHSGKRGGIQDADDAGCSGLDIDCHAGYKDAKSKLEYLDKTKHSRKVAEKLAKLAS